MKNVSRFFLCGIITEILYLAFYLINPLKNLLGDHDIVLRDDRLFAYVIANLLLLTLIYAKAFREVSRKKISSFSIISFSILFNLTLLFVWPISSSDIFSHIYISRIISQHHANPYEVTYASFPNDEFYPLINNTWSLYTSTSAPLFMVLGSILSTIGGNALLLNVLLFKSLFAVLNILNIFLIKNITKRNASIFLYAWNPLILFEFSLNGHYDVLLISFFLLSLVFVFKKTSLKSYLLGWCFLSLSILTKFFTGIFALPYIIFSIYRLRTLSDKLTFLMGSIVLGSLLAVIFYFPFWLGGSTFTRFFEVMDMNSIFASPGVLTLARVLSIFSIENFFGWSKLLNKFFFFTFYIIALVILVSRKKNQSKETLLFYFVMLFIVFLLTFLNWLMPWYLGTLIVLLSIYIGLSQKYKYSFYIILVTIYGIMHYLILR